MYNLNHVYISSWVSSTGGLHHLASKTSSMSWGSSNEHSDLSDKVVRCGRSIWKHSDML